MPYRFASLPTVLSAICFGLCLAPCVASADSLRCDNKVISTGDTTFRVKQYCGEPEQIARRVEYETVRHRVSAPCADNPARRCSVVEEVTREIPYEDWTYDFGPQKLIRILSFRAAELVAVRTDGYGQRR